MSNPHSTRRVGRPLGDMMRERFCVAYIEHGSAKKASTKIGISSATGYDWMQQEDIEERIRELMCAVREQGEIEAAEVIGEIVRIALADPADAYDGEMRLKSLHDMPPALRKTIAAVKCEEMFERNAEGEKVLVGYLKEIKFWDKVRGLEMLARHLALFRDSISVTDGTLTIDNPVIAARVASLLDEIRRRASVASTLI